MKKSDLRKVLADIFDPSVLTTELPKHELNKPPSLKDIESLASLIAEEKEEESFQQFLSKNPHFLFRLTPSSDDTVLGFLNKPPISNFNIADFGIYIVNQGGCRVFLIEIERPSDKLFTKALTPAKKLQVALGQIHDWNEWLQTNRETFVRSSFKILKESPRFPKKRKNGSFIYCSPEHLEGSWAGFGGDHFCTFEYLILIGRWSKLSEREKNRLVYYNRSYESQNIKIRTYDNFIRKAIEGPRFFW